MRGRECLLRLIGRLVICTYSGALCSSINRVASTTRSIHYSLEDNFAYSKATWRSASAHWICACAAYCKALTRSVTRISSTALRGCIGSWSCGSAIFSFLINSGGCRLLELWCPSLSPLGALTMLVLPIRRRFSMLLAENVKEKKHRQTPFATINVMNTLRLSPIAAVGSSDLVQTNPW